MNVPIDPNCLGLDGMETLRVPEPNVVDLCRKLEALQRQNRDLLRACRMAHDFLVDARVLHPSHHLIRELGAVISDAEEQ